MRKFQQLIVAACVAGISSVAFASALHAKARQCSAERPQAARAYWSYRLIDGRKCWYEGKPMLSKSLLHWPSARTKQAERAEREPSVLPAAGYNFLDAQASMPDSSDSFEARWRGRFLDAIGK